MGYLFDVGKGNVEFSAAVNLWKRGNYRNYAIITKCVCRVCHIRKEPAC